MGRHTTFTQEAADKIVVRLSTGEPLAQICRDDGMPAIRTVSDWREAHPDFAAAFARARDDGFDRIAEDCLHIADDNGKDRRYTPDGKESIDSDHISRSKLRVETRLKLLAKWDPRRYGDKIAHVGGDKDDAPIRSEVAIDVTKLTREQLEVLASIPVGGGGE